MSRMQRILREYLSAMVSSREGDVWMASPTQWTWVWERSRSWWWTGKPDVLQSMGSQRVRHDWVIELNWTDRPHARSMTVGIWKLCWDSSMALYSQNSLSSLRGVLQPAYKRYPWYRNSHTSVESPRTEGLHGPICSSATPGGPKRNTKPLRAASPSSHGKPRVPSPGIQHPKYFAFGS